MIGASPWERRGLPLLVTAWLVGMVLLPLVWLVGQVAVEGVGSTLEAMGRSGGWEALARSALLGVVAVAVNGVLGLIGALALVRRDFPGRGVLDALVDLPLAVAPVMIGLAFLLLFGRDGLLYAAMGEAGVRVAFAFPGLVLATLFVTVPFTLREVSHVLREAGFEEEEAAATLGATGWQTFWRVTLPKVRLGLTYGATLTLARALGEFGAVLVLGGAITGQTDTATTFIYAAVEERQEAAAAGMSLVLAALTLGLLGALQWLQRRTTHRGA